MKHEPLTRLALVVVAVVVLLAIVPTSCKQNPSGTSAASSGVQRRDSADSAYWDKYTEELLQKVVDFHNNGKTDSLEDIVPEALKICREHNQKERYYYIWKLFADEYIYDGEFKKAVAEAQRMQDTAMKCHDDYGIFLSYTVLGQGYANKGDYKASVKYLQKALDFYHSGIIGPVFTTYNFLTQVLVQLKRYEEADSAMMRWNKMLEENAEKKGAENYETWCSWKNNFFIQKTIYMMSKEKYKEAAEALDSAEYYTMEEGNTPLNRMAVLEQKSYLSESLGDYQTALDCAQQMKALAIESGEDTHRISAMIAEIDALYDMKRYKEAAEQMISYTAFRDSLNEVSAVQQLNELNKRFEVNELKMQAERDKMQAERRQLYLVIAIIVLAVIGGGLFAYYRYRSAKRMAAMRVEQERIENELQIARDIQMSMVPSTFPDYEGLDMYASMTPAKEVGGDLYGYVMIGSRLYFAVGDVSGKGVPASLFMAQATRLFRTLAAQQMMPAEICTRMNDALSGDDNTNGMFVTMFLGLIDLETGHMDFCNAGHNPPVIATVNCQLLIVNCQFLEMQPNAPIGLWPGLEYEGEEIDNVKGRALFVYTDGLNEAENTAQEQFGDERLLELMQNMHFDSSRQLIERLKDEVEQHRNGAVPNDDLTMMGVYLRS